MADLVPKIDLPQYFTVTSMGVADNLVDVSIHAEPAHGKPPYQNTHAFAKTHLVLEDLVDLFPVDHDKVPKLARVFLSSIALPRDFQLAASRVEGHPNTIELSFELRGDKPKRWGKTFDTSRLNLKDLGVLLDWAKEAIKYQR